MSLLIMKLVFRFWLFGPVKHFVFVFVWFAGAEWLCISKESRSYFTLHLFSKHLGGNMNRILNANTDMGVFQNNKDPHKQFILLAALKKNSQPLS